MKLVLGVISTQPTYVRRILDRLGYIKEDIPIVVQTLNPLAYENVIRTVSWPAKIEIPLLDKKFVVLYKDLCQKYPNLLGSSSTFTTGIQRTLLFLYIYLKYPGSYILSLDEDIVITPSELNHVKTSLNSIYEKDNKVIIGYPLGGVPDLSRRELIELFLLYVARYQVSPDLYQKYKERVGNFVWKLVEANNRNTIIDILARFMPSWIKRDFGYQKTGLSKRLISMRPENISGGAFLSSSETISSIPFPNHYSEDWLWFDLNEYILKTRKAIDKEIRFLHLPVSAKELTTDLVIEELKGNLANYFIRNLINKTNTYNTEEMIDNPRLLNILGRLRTTLSLLNDIEKNTGAKSLHQLAEIVSYVESFLRNRDNIISIFEYSSQVVKEIKAWKIN